jgi:hypothetical protein
MNRIDLAEEFSSRPSSICSWIEGLPYDTTAYVDPAIPFAPNLLHLWTSNRRALGEIPLNALPPMSSSQQHDGVRTPRKKRARTDGADDETETPRARAELRTPHYPSLGPSVPLSASSSPSRSSRSASSKVRSVSPSKRVGDLQLFERTITYLTVNDKNSPLPSTANRLTSRIKRIATGKGLVPASLKVQNRLQ